MNAKRRSFTVTGIALGTLVALGSMGAWAKDKEKEDPTEEISKARSTIEMYKADDPGLVEHLETAAGYVVFPQVGKGGFVVGGAGGKGILFEKGKATGRASMTQVTVGAQAGGQSYSEVIIFKDAAALNDFKRSAFEFSSDASAVAGGAGASATLKYTRGIAVMTKSKGGLMAEASIGSQKFKFTPFDKPISVPKT